MDGSIQPFINLQQTDIHIWYW